MTVGKKTSSFEREVDDWYVEPGWTVDLLLSAISFTGSIWDPACGAGTILKACQRAGHNNVMGTDLIDRGYGLGGLDFLDLSPERSGREDNIITNPPYKHTEAFIKQSLELCHNKAAFIVPLKFLSSNSRFFLFDDLPIWRVCILSSRPSMPPGRYIDPETFTYNCDDPNPKRGYTGIPGIIWLKREGAKARPYNSDRRRKVAPESTLNGRIG